VEEEQQQAGKHYGAQTNTPGNARTQPVSVSFLSFGND
jgi:hypothetical protein